MINSPSFFNRAGKRDFLWPTFLAKEVVWWSDTFFFRRTLINFFKFHLERRLKVKSEVLPSNEFIESWLDMIRVDCTSLSVDSRVENRELERVFVLGVQRNLREWGSSIIPRGPLISGGLHFYFTPPLTTPFLFLQTFVYNVYLPFLSLCKLTSLSLLLI